ncbi:MAG: phosphate-selective porin OprO and OprP [Alphaproteobacteria bacterium]|nr:phosphate-selective porin OprO and OprP [Alphaproteobacteria bacterium]
MIFRAMKAANVESVAQLVAVGGRERHTRIRARIAGAALLAAMICFPALGQSLQPGSWGGTPDVPATGPAGWFWALEEWRPTLSSSDGHFTMSFRARFQFDAGWFDQSQDVTSVTPQRDVQFKDLRSGTMTRRAYLGVEGRAFGEFSYEYRMNFGDTRSFLTNPFINIARVSYNVGDLANLGESHFRIDAGLIRPILTYEDTTSSAALIFLERADAVNVATTSYGGGTPRLGFQLTFQTPDTLRPGDNLLVSGALTGQNSVSNNTAFPSNATFDGTKIFGRIAYRLSLGDFDGIQVGGSASRIVSVGGSGAADGAHIVTLQDHPEIRVDGHRLVSTGEISAKGGSLLGLEAVGNIRDVYISGEFYEFGVDRAPNCAGCVISGDPSFSGWYVTASWVLTGERRIYQPVATNSSFATFTNPHLATAFSFDGRDWGAWEIAARYSDLDLNWHAGTLQTTCAGAFIGCIRGGEEKIWTFGLNWYLSNNIRMQFDYMAIDVNKLNASGQQIGQVLGAIGTRLQLTN